MIKQNATRALESLHEEIVTCRRCPRLVAFREEVAHIKRRAYRHCHYWGKPVPSFGDPFARLLIVGLAPGAHGANRTGRLFTGDRSGVFLYRALWETQFANQAHSVSLDDGLALTDAYISSPVRCVPPDNKPSREEIATCIGYFARELEMLSNVQVVVPLGGIALQAYLSVLKNQGVVKSLACCKFGHGVEFKPAANSPHIVCSYHPSQQNTSTGRLTEAMLREVFLRARELFV